MAKKKIVEEPAYYQTKMGAYDALRKLIANINGQYYTCQGEFIFRTPDHLYLVINTTNGYIIASYYYLPE
jgi:hypothetical protein